MSKKEAKSKMKFTWCCVKVVDVRIAQSETTPKEELVEIEFDYLNPPTGKDKQILKSITVRVPSQLAPESELTRIIEKIKDAKINFTKAKPVTINLHCLLNDKVFILIAFNEGLVYVKDIATFTNATRDSKIIRKILNQRQRIDCAPGYYLDICNTCPVLEATGKKPLCDFLKEIKHPPLIITSEKSISNEKGAQPKA